MNCKPLPHSDEAEQGILGCILLDASCLDRCSKLVPEVFYDFRHRLFYETCVAMRSEGKPIDLIALQEELKPIHNGLQRCGGLPYIAALPDKVPSALNLDYYIGIALEKYRLRKLIRTCTEIQEKASNGGCEPSEVILHLEDAAKTLSAQDDVVCDFKGTVLELINDWELALEGKNDPGVNTGLYDLDKIIGGLRPQQLCVIAARPSVGKTSLAINIAERAAVEDKLPTILFTLEMSAKEVVERFVCSRARVNSSSLRSGKATPANLMAVTTAQLALVGSKLLIIDIAAPTIARLAALSRQLVKKHLAKLVIVDYLGLIRCGEKNKSRYEETTLVSNALKAMAKSLQVPLIALAQLNRDSERKNRRPQLSDCRDTGAIEQDADIVVLMHREEGEPGAMQTVILDVAKNRGGATGYCEVLFNRQFTRFENMSKHHQTYASE